MNTMGSSMHKTMAKNQKDKQGKPEVKKKAIVNAGNGSAVVTKKAIVNAGDGSAVVKKKTIVNAGDGSAVSTQKTKPFPAINPQENQGPTKLQKQRQAAASAGTVPPPGRSISDHYRVKAEEAAAKAAANNGDLDLESGGSTKKSAPTDVFMGGMFQKKEPPKNAAEKRKNKRESPPWTMGYTRGEFMLVMWALWMIIGTAYYASPGGMNLGFCKGFFKAVDVGYSIGWGWPAEETNGQMIFSVIYCIVGASFVAMALGFFADSVIADSDSWFDNLQEKAEYVNIMSKHDNWWNKVYEYTKYHWLKVRIVLLWFVWLAFGMIFVSATHDDNFSEGLIFSVTSMSTGGLRGLPIDAPDWEWFIVGAFAATGVPLMGLAMGTIAQALLDHDSLEDVEEVLNEPVTEEELDRMQNFGFDDDGLISLQEYIILSTVRLGLVDPQAIELMALKYATFDVDGDGQVTYKELIEDANHIDLNRQDIKFINRELVDVELGDNVDEYGFYVDEEEEEEEEEETEEEKIRRLVREEREKEQQEQREVEEIDRIRKLITEERKKQDDEDKKIAKEIVSEQIRREREVELDLARENMREIELAKERNKEMESARNSQKERERLRELKLAESVAAARLSSSSSLSTKKKKGTPSKSPSKSPSRRARIEDNEVDKYNSDSMDEIPVKASNKSRISPKLRESPLKASPLRSSEESARELADAEAEFNAHFQKFLPSNSIPGRDGSPSKNISTQKSRVRSDDDNSGAGRKDRISPTSFSPEGKKKALPPLSGPAPLSRK